MNEKVNIPIVEAFPNEYLYQIKDSLPWLTDIVNYLAEKHLPVGQNIEQRKRFLENARCYFWKNPLLYKICVDSMMKKMCPLEEVKMCPLEEVVCILNSCHS